jgi:DNA repair photolyase
VHAGQPVTSTREDDLDSDLPSVRSGASRKDGLAWTPAIRCARQSLIALRLTKTFNVLLGRTLRSPATKTSSTRAIADGLLQVPFGKELSDVATMPGALMRSPKSNLLTWDRGRVFIDVASSGCGSGCSYCYIDAPSGTQILASTAEVDQALECLENDPRFVPGPQGSLVSLSPNSDPFKSPASTVFALKILRAVLPLGNPVQIPTKEIIPGPLTKCLDELSQSDRQTVIFVSLSSIKNGAQLEPNAASVQDRLRNAKLLRGHRCQSCAYIKPFLRSANAELDSFVESLNNAAFDLICVGMRYSAQRTQPRLAPAAQPVLSGGPHPTKDRQVAHGLTPDLIHFHRQLSYRCAPTPVFLTSPCVNAFALDREPSIPVWKELPSLCISCRSCGKSVS